MIRPDQTGLEGAALAFAWFLWYWFRKDAPDMHMWTTLTWQANEKEAGVKLCQARIEGQPLADVVGVGARQGSADGACLRRVRATVRYSDGRAGELTGVAVRETAAYEASEEGTWGVNPVSLRFKAAE